MVRDFATKRRFEVKFEYSQKSQIEYEVRQEIEQQKKDLILSQMETLKSQGQDISKIKKTELKKMLDFLDNEGPMALAETAEDQSEKRKTKIKVDENG
jgi:hypothetical protein